MPKLGTRCRAPQKFAPAQAPRGPLTHALEAALDRWEYYRPQGPSCERNVAYDVASQLLRAYLTGTGTGRFVWGGYVYTLTDDDSFCRNRVK